MFKVHVHCIVFVTLWHVLYILVNIDQNKKKQITTCKQARQESSIDLYSLRRI